MQLPDAGPVLVVGPGAIGVLLAARLADHGIDVVLAARDTAGACALAAGLAATAPDGSTVHANVPVITRPKDLPAAPRLLAIATKCADAEAALRTWLPMLDEETPVVTLQNGIMGGRVKPIVGERLVECTVSFPATLTGPGHSTQTGPGGLHIGPWPKAGPRDDPKAFRAVAKILAETAPVTASANMQGVKWTKLAINSCITSLGVLTGVELGQLLARSDARRAFLRIVEEAYAVGRADGVQFEAVSGFRPGLFGRRLPGRSALVGLIGRKYRRHRSSSLQSLERGRRTEVDWLNGHIVAAGQRHGLAAPVNSAIVELVHAIEVGDRAPDPRNLADIPL